MALRFDGETYSIDELTVIDLVRNTPDVKAHTHQFVELVYILRGKTVQVIDGVRYPAAHGDMLLINEGESHAMTCQAGTEYINVLMKPKIISNSMGHSGNAFSLLMLKDFSDFQNTVNCNNRLMRFEGSERTYVELLLEQLLQQQKTPQSGSGLMLRSGLNMLLILVFRKMALPIYPLENGIDDQLLAYIRDNCATRLSLEQLAESRGYESSYFSRMFKRHTGKTFTGYLTQCRMEKACFLLENTQKPVDTVISDCGFSDRTKFFRLFAAYTGMTPLKYRKSKN